MQKLITNSYEHELAYHFHNIDNRGLLIDTKKKEEVRFAVQNELDSNCRYLEKLWSFPVYIGADNAPDDKNDREKALNINSTQKLLSRIKDLGYNIPKIRKKDEETDEYEYKDSVAKLALVILLSDPTRWPSPLSGEGIKRLLEVKEAITFRNRYLNARLHKDIYYSNYNVAATLTGRRGSKKNLFGLGGNSQNFPSRGRLSGLWKKCIIARPGRIFFFVDQVSAEDWPVQALAENHTALQQMRQGVNRHYIFASQIFNISIDDLKKARDNYNNLYTKEQQETAELQYYMGKKGRHSNNYGMQPKRFSESLAAEGNYTVPVDECKKILAIVDRIDPNVKRIFHKYIQECLAESAHKLVTPLGRERQFLGLRSGEKNYSIFNEAYSYIPQSTVGDNTGLAICELEKQHDYILQDGHDSLCQELPDNERDLRTVFRNTANAFKRTITFHNGIDIEIPIEGQIGYDWKDKIKMKHFTEDCLIDTYKKVKEQFGRCDKSSMMTTV